MKVILIRHGKTPGNEEGRYIGETDESLSRQGERELQEMRERCPRAELLFSSPMKRCIETASILYPELSPLLLPELRERSFGRYEGKNYQELERDDAYQGWLRSGGSLPFPDGEREEEVRERILRGFRKIERILREQSAEDTAAAVITHGGVVMTLLSEKRGGNFYDYQIKNGSFLELDLEDIRV